MTLTKCIPFRSGPVHGASFVERRRLLVDARRDVPLLRQSTLFDFRCKQCHFIRLSALQSLPFRNMYLFLLFPGQSIVNPTQPTYYSFSFRTLSLILIYMLGSCITMRLFCIAMNIYSTTTINPGRRKSDRRTMTFKCKPLWPRACGTMRTCTNVHHCQERHNTTV